ncbi:MAG: hypothetical protein EPO22_08115 [Dehalococcoidia bacterium]|nr:MAG: hypothetical protein EPO22_08115 [Dehalococcoidia bacterium]
MALLGQVARAEWHWGRSAVSGQRSAVSSQQSAMSRGDPRLGPLPKRQGEIEARNLLPGSIQSRVAGNRTAGAAVPRASESSGNWTAGAAVPTCMQASAEIRRNGWCAGMESSGARWTPLPETSAGEWADLMAFAEMRLT